MSDITLTASIRSNLLSLQNTTQLLNTTSERLSTGKRVNSALDNPNSFFTARGLSNRATDLTSRKDSIGQSISLLQATDKSINSITALVEQAKAVAQQAEEAATSGVATISTSSATLSGVTTVKSEAVASGNGSSTTSIDSTAHTGAAATFTTISSAAITATNGPGNTTTAISGEGTGSIEITDTSTQTVHDIYALAAAADQFTIAAGGESVTITGTTTLDEFKTIVETLDNVTVNFDTLEDEINIVASGGSALTFTDVDGSAALAALDFQGGDSATITTGGSHTFLTAQDATDTVAAAFAVTAADTLTLNVTGADGSTNNTEFTVGNKTVAELVTYIGDLDDSITATFNTATNAIDITSSNSGEEITLTSTVAATFAFTGAAVLETGTAVSFTSTATDSDTLVSAFGATATDSFSIEYNGQSTVFTVGNSTIADLTAAITNLDADLTATYDTADDKIKITSGAGGAALTFTDLVGAASVTELDFNNGTGDIVSGTAEAFQSNGNASDLASVAFGLDSAATFTVSVAGAGSSTINVGSKTVAELVTAISNVDSVVTATFNSADGTIDISSPTGQEVTFTDSAAVAQVNSVTFGGGIKENDVYSVTVNGTKVDYTILAADLAADGVSGAAGTEAQKLGNLATKIAAAIDADGTVGGLVNVTANTGAGSIEITAVTAGTTLNISAANTVETAGTPLTSVLANSTGAAAAATKVDTLTLGGGVNAGDVVSYSVNDTNYSYTVTGLEADSDAVASALAALVQADALVATATAVGSVITITSAAQDIEYGSTTSVAANDVAASATTSVTTAAVAGGAVTGLGLTGGGSALSSGTGVTFTDTTVAVTSGDLLTSAYSGLSVGNSFTIATATGSTNTFTVAADTTVSDLVTAIGGADSSLTASFNTTSRAIEIAGSTGAAVTFTDVSGTSVASLGLTNGTSNLTSGTATTYGSSGSASEVATLNTDFASILGQIDTLLNDSSYKGTNLLSGSNDFIVKFNADGSSSLTLTGLDLGVTGNTDLKFTLDAGGYDFTGSGITTALADTQNAIDHLRSVASTFGTGLGIIQTREEFTSQLVSVLQSGSDKLINANLEEESANLLALQTRQALGIQSLSIANQSQQSVLSLFR